MNILCVDDEKLAVNLLKDLCEEINSDVNVSIFTNPVEALNFAQNSPIDVALLDVDMPEMSGIELGKQLKNFLPDINIIMVTAYSQYSLDAFNIDASGYLTKPISVEKLRHQFEVLRFPIKNNLSSRVRISNIDAFQILIDESVPKFKYKKTLEMLEYLVDQKGRFCSNSDIELALWNDNEDHYEYVKSLKKDLHSVLNNLGADNIILSDHGRIAINQNLL